MFGQFHNGAAIPCPLYQRIMYACSFVSPVLLIYDVLKILKIEDLLLHLDILAHVYKFINKVYSTPKSSLHRFGTHQATRGDLFKYFKNTTLYGSQTIQYCGSKVWNTLPLFICVASCLSSSITAKDILHQFLFIIL